MAQLKYNDLMNPGHLGCPGCGATIAMKFALQALGEKTMVVIPACCWGVIAGPYPQSALKVPILHTAFATAGAAASGLRAALTCVATPKPQFFPGRVTAGLSISAFNP
jgi:pyruvate/2-oxoacid:ferredoxin oxidoreductase beta subunit